MAYSINLNVTEDQTLIEGESVRTMRNGRVIFDGIALSFSGYGSLYLEAVVASGIDNPEPAPILSLNVQKPADNNKPPAGKNCALKEAF